MALPSSVPIWYWTNEKLIEAIRTVLRGERFFSDTLETKLVTSALGNTPAEQTPTHHRFWANEKYALTIKHLLGGRLQNDTL